MELRRAGVELSSGVVLKDPGQQQQTGLPYGLIWTPFNAVDDINLTSQPPPKCATCQGLYSRLCQVDRVTMLWKCVLCGLLNDARHIPTIPRDNEGNTARMTSDVDVAEYILPSEGNSNVDSRLIFIIDEHIGIDEIEMAKIAEIATSAAIERGLYSAKDKPSRFRIFLVYKSLRS
uniref:Protein transport protein SEC23 n=1 Tax=Rhodosorus marinus TaxID=101924 RepID=A0A7S3EK40_9RHOD|mmetsp:Transcript_39819/g.158350  ORF Transcript_39819/g.158350 Transcript_39819/m.158350 type:complete len:176 (+) Transcript_39819:1664-2191(+)